jgi:hypothetical protein
MAFELTRFGVAADYESRGQEFESLRARQIATIQNKTANSGLDRQFVVGPLLAQLSGEVKLRQADFG